MPSLLVLSAYPERVAANHAWWDPWPWDVFMPVTSGVREAHHELAVHAVAEGWGPEVKVVQDDVEPHEWPPHVGFVTAYAGRKHPRHTCPRAFSASPGGWRRLAVAWGRDGKTCRLWRPDHVYDVATHHP